MHFPFEMLVLPIDQAIGKDREQNVGSNRPNDRCGYSQSQCGEYLIDSRQIGRVRESHDEFECLNKCNGHDYNESYQIYKYGNQNPDDWQLLVRDGSCMDRT